MMEVAGVSINKMRISNYCISFYILSLVNFEVSWEFSSNDFLFSHLIVKIWFIPTSSIYLCFLAFLKFLFVVQAAPLKFKLTCLIINLSSSVELKVEIPANVSTPNPLSG